MTWSIPPQPYIFLKLKPRKMMGKIEFRPESDRTTRTRVTDYFVEYISEIRYAPTCAARSPFKNQSYVIAFERANSRPTAGQHFFPTILQFRSMPTQIREAAHVFEREAL